MEYISLCRDLVARIDEEDYRRLSKHRWHVRGQKPHCYAVTRDKKTRKLIRMHRLVIGAQTGQIVDHINGDTLDNRSVNLRIVSSLENVRNRRKTSASTTSKFKGVYRARDKWRAQIRVNGKLISLGYHLIEEEAARAYDDAALKYFGDCANMNFLAQLKFRGRMIVMRRVKP